MISVEFGGVGREASETGVRHDLGVELAIRRGSDGIEPIHGRGSPLTERPVEEVRGRSVLQNFRAVLAAQQIHVIDPEIGWDLLVGGWLVGAFPLHRPGGPAAEAIGRPGEALPVGPGHPEHISVGARRKRLVELVVDVVVDIGDEPGAGRQRLGEIPKPVQAETGHDLAHCGAGVGHQPSRRSSPMRPPPNRRVNCSWAPIRSAGRSSAV